MPFKIKGKYLAPTAQGKLSNREWSSQLPKVSAKQERGIHKHWARLKIKELSQQLSMRSHFSEGYDTIKKNIEDGITKVALTHNLVSQFTSLIAIDYLDHADIKAMQLAKHQSQQTKRFTQSRLPSTATPAGLLALIGSLLLFLSLLLLKRSGSKPKC